ncbi:MAG: sulfatase-like hydrolase/transferase [Butyrivibrio sp.]|nr:sulfatase-like hydrolase/transferase [Butyrivibrio sp.]
MILAEDENFLTPLDGFTYYPNATSVHSRTYPSIAYLLTGNMCYFDQKPQEYVNMAYKDSNFIPTLYENGIEVGLYTYLYHIGDSAKPQLCNYVSEKHKLDFSEIIKLSVKMNLYRDMPYLVKRRFEYDISEINNRVVEGLYIEEAEEEGSAEPFRIFDDEWFAGRLTENGLTASEEDGCFRFYHLASAHANLSDAIPPAMRSFEIVYEYLEQMRKLGIYDDAMVIITTDHGYSGGGDTLDMPHQTAVPILFVKPSGVSGSEMQISEAPVSHTEFIPTILDGFSLDYADYGMAVYDIEEISNRDRFYYYSALYTDEEGEVELREYKVSGDARIPDSYHFTGNKWDIRYSYNIVAKK